MHKQYSNSF